MRRAKSTVTTLIIVLVVPRAVGAQQTRFPEGTFIAQEALDPHAISRNAGVEFDFVAGQYQVRRDGELRVLGQYALRGHQITITDIEGPWACVTSDASSATYSWRVEDDRLLLALDGEDTCNRRRNRLTDVVLLKGRAPPLPETVSAPAELIGSWQRFWVESDVPGWIDEVFAPDAIAQDGNRRLNGIEEIRGWLTGQDSQNPQAFPFEFSRSGDKITEKGRYRDIFGSPDGSTRLLVGRYQITWVQAEGPKWKVQEWILR